MGRSERAFDGVPALVNELVPKMYWAAANSDEDALRYLALRPGLFQGRCRDWLPAMCLGYTGALVRQFVGAEGQAPTDDDLDRFLPRAISLFPVSPVPLEPPTVARLLRRAAGRAERYEWERQSSAFELADLAGFVVIGGAAIVLAGWGSATVHGSYAQVLPLVEHEFRGMRRVRKELKLIRETR